MVLGAVPGRRFAARWSCVQPPVRPGSKTGSNAYRLGAGDYRRFFDRLLRKSFVPLRCTLDLLDPGTRRLSAMRARLSITMY